MDCGYSLEMCEKLRTSIKAILLVVVLNSSCRLPGLLHSPSRPCFHSEHEFCPKSSLSRSASRRRRGPKRSPKFRSSRSAPAQSCRQVQSVFRENTSATSHLFQNRNCLPAQKNVLTPTRNLFSVIRARIVFLPGW